MFQVSRGRGHPTFLTALLHWEERRRCFGMGQFPLPDNEQRIHGVGACHKQLPGRWQAGGRHVIGHVLCRGHVLLHLRLRLCFRRVGRTLKFQLGQHLDKQARPIYSATASIPSASIQPWRPPRQRMASSALSSSIPFYSVHSISTILIHSIHPLSPHQRPPSRISSPISINAFCSLSQCPIIECSLHPLPPILLLALGYQGGTACSRIRS